MRSVVHKWMLASLLIILLPMTLAILWSSKTLSTLLERRFAEKARAQAEQIKLLLRERQETATGLVHWIAEMPGVQDALVTGNRDGLFQHLLPLVGSIQLDFIEVLDASGKIFLRVHDPTAYGDAPSLAADIDGLLRGAGEMVNYGIEVREGVAYLRAAQSINGARVLGVVSAGYALNADFISRLERLAGGSVDIATAPPYFAAKTDPRARQTSVDRNPEPLQEPGENLEIRLPLETDRGVEGLISVFFPTQEMTAAIATLRMTLSLVAVVGIALALAASWHLSRRLTRPLNELVSGTQQVAAGNYSVIVRAGTNDEIGALAASFNHMLEELRRSKAEVESYRCELEQKVAERSKQLIETEQKRAAMAHMIAHDLKNPLLGIKKTLERLEQAPNELSGTQGKRILVDLLSAGDLVIGMLNEMLDLYRSDFGEIPLSPSSFQLQEIIHSSLRILGPDIEEKRIRLAIHLYPFPDSVVGDKRRLTRLVINLLSNAIKFSPEQGSVAISATAREQNGAGTWLELCVEDEGLGIPKHDLPKIFDRFYSRDKEQAETGTGLGLPYCKLVAEAHGGHIRAENREQGGFAVTVALPMRAWKSAGVYAA